MNRRDFLQAATASGLSFASAVGVTEIRADAKKDAPTGPPVGCAVIGLGKQGQDILASLAKLGGSRAPIYGICDTYQTPVFVKRSTEIAPSATFANDYRRTLDDKKVQAVFVATPSHLHKQIVIDALQAGKHVYCEAPLATDLNEAKAIAQAAMAAKTFFMPGLQVRSNAQAAHVGHFVKAGDIGRVVQGRGQWHKRSTWRLAHPDAAREKELNWRLAKETSTGLIGEIGIHQIDSATRYLNALPTAVSGYSALVEYKDGRTVPDMAQCIVEYPKGVSFLYDASLISTFEGAYEVFYATSSTILLRDQRAWMFKEADSNTLGWEGYARRDVLRVGEPANGTGEALGTGIALVADASKQLALGKKPSEIGTDVSKTSLYQAVDAFTGAISMNKKPAVGPLEGYQATVVAHKCNDAVTNKTRIELTPEMFAL